MDNKTKTPDQYFEEIRQRMNTPEKVGRKLTQEEEARMRDGFWLEETTKTPGWKILADILANMPKAHVDPRGMTEEQWKFAELNAFWQGAVASELSQALGQLIQDAHEIHKIQTGEVKTPTMRI